MNRTDPSAAATAFRFAEEAIRSIAVANVPGVAHNLLFRVKNAATYHERSQIAQAQKAFVEAQEVFLATFAASLRQGIEEDVGAEALVSTTKTATDWQSIGLVDEDRIEESIGSKRLGQLIGHASDAETRELDGYTAALLGLASAEESRNPLRGDIIGAALHRSIEKIADDASTQKILSRELGQAMADAMPACYRSIIDTMKARGVRPIDRAMKAVDESARRPAAAAAGRGDIDEMRRAMEASWVGRPPPPTQPQPEPPGADPLRSWESSILGRMGQADPLPPGFDVGGASALLDRLMRGAMPTAMAPASRSSAQAAADQHLTDMLRRISVEATGKPEFVRTQRDSGYGAFNTGGGALTQQTPFGPLDANELTGLVAVNLIRAHRNELEQATRSKVDHLVIEVVSSLFDQILSDSRVPPQMARQIARLQLPVLRVALVDPRFFSSRRHPVRRFINRIASLASAVDGFESGPGAGLLERVGALVTEIVEGDFDQLEVYDAKLDALQRFVDDQAREELSDTPAAPTLLDKEAEWHVLVAFASRLTTALEPLALPAFVRDFLCGVWAQAIVVAARRDGEASATVQQLRQTMSELVASLQPKRSPEDRRRFVAALPGLMAGLTDGTESVGWPASSREAFFGELMALHTGALKAPPGTDLDHNMRLRQLDAAVRTPVPRAGASDDPAATGMAVAAIATVDPAVIEPHFSPAEQRSIGLVSEASVDWSSAVAVDAVATAAASAEKAEPPPAVAPATHAVGDGESLPIIDTSALDAPAPAAPVATLAPSETDPPPPSDPELATGLALRDHLQLGFSYRLNLKGRWEKVRLTYMSPSRTLFLFSHGARDRETVSMTARLLGRLCEAGRLRAFENDYLVERSTVRAREQLALAGAAANASV